MIVNAHGCIEEIRQEITQLTKIALKQTLGENIELTKSNYASRGFLFLFFLESFYRV